MNKNIKRVGYALATAGLLLPSFTGSTIAHAIDATVLTCDGGTTTIEEGNYSLSGNLSCSVVVEGEVGIDLGGYELAAPTGKDAIWVKHGATLTLENGTVTGPSKSYSAIINQGTTTANEVSFRLDENNTDKPMYVINNQGQMVLNNSSATRTTSQNASVVNVGYYYWDEDCDEICRTKNQYRFANGEPQYYVEGRNDAQPKLTINGGSYDGGGVEVLKSSYRGKIVIEDGEFEANELAEGWLVQGTGIVEIKGGVFNTVDESSAIVIYGCNESEGKFDACKLSISGGTFNSDDAIYIYPGYEESGFDIAIFGGTFSSEPNADYIAEDHDVYQLSDEGPWAVDEFDEDSFNFPETGLFVKKGETLDLSEYIGETARKYVTIGSGDREIATVDKLKITGVETGKTFLNINLHNSIYPYEENIEIGVYEIAENKDDEEFEDADTAALKTQLASFLDDVLDGTVKEDEDGRATNDKATIYEVDILKRVLATGATIITDYRQLDLLKLYNDILEEQDITWTIDDVVKYLVEIASENHGEEAGKTLEAALAGKNLINAFEGHVVITDSEDNAGPLGEINELDSPLKLVFPIAEGYRTAPDGYTRKFFAVRVHYNSDGEIETEEIPATFDGENAIIENDKFSTFYLAYEDVKNEETNPNTFDRGITTFAVLGGITVPTLVAAAWFLAKKNS